MTEPQVTTREAQQWCDGGDTASGKNDHEAGDVTGTMRLRELVVGRAELYGEADCGKEWAWIVTGTSKSRC